MSKWTPGPWDAMDEQDGCGTYAISSGRAYEDVGIAYGGANARLIAAAPEMADEIAALIDALEAAAGAIADDDFFNDCDPQELAQTMADRASNARALLARLEG